MPPRTPPGFRSIPISPSELTLSTTIASRCGQAFRWTCRPIHDTLPLSPPSTVPSTPTPFKEDASASPSAASKRATALADLAALDDTQLEWSMAIRDRVVFLRQDAEAIHYRAVMPSPSTPSVSALTSATSTAKGQAKEEDGSTLEFLKDYFQLEVKLADLYDEWSAVDPVFAKHAVRFRGVRMLRQDPFECLMAFICSSNNNIARITGMVQNLCTHFSRPLLVVPTADPSSTTTSYTYHPFPSPSALAQPEVEAKLRELGFGYRAKYIAQTARILVEMGQAGGGDEKEEALSHGKGKASSSEGLGPDQRVYAYLSSLRTLPYPAARAALQAFPGVGPKVADCILLFSLDQPESIPVDRHVFQFAQRWYGVRGRYEEVAEKLRGVWGRYSGWAHSVLFTADLKSFSSYSSTFSESKPPLPTPAATPTAAADVLKGDAVVKMVKLEEQEQEKLRGPSTPMSELRSEVKEETVPQGRRAADSAEGPGRTASRARTTSRPRNSSVKANASGRKATTTTTTTTRISASFSATKRSLSTAGAGSVKGSSATESVFKRVKVATLAAPPPLGATDGLRSSAPAKAEDEEERVHVHHPDGSLVDRVKRRRRPVSGGRVK